MADAVRVLFFADARDRVGTPELEVLTASAPTVGTLRDYLARRYSQLGPLLPRIAVAVNESYADDATKLNSGDVVAIIPPVSGG